MVAFAFAYRAAVERHCERRGFSVEAVLRTVHPDAATLWARLEQAA
jgi:hypothetical protein